MEPIAYVPFLNEKYQSLGFPPYKWTINETTTFAPLKKPLTECRVSLLSTCGASRTCDPPFDPDARNDLRCDDIPSDALTADFEVNDNYYDHTDVSVDLNCMMPLDRLRELAASGVIGSVAPRVYSGFMGRIYNRSEVVNDAAPKLVEKLKQDGVDVLVVVPACPLDHQTAGLVARVVEEAGIPTVNVSTGRDLSRNVLPPRTVFVNFPMGNAFGRPGDVAQQCQILSDALHLVADAKEPGAFVDLPYDWGAPFTFRVRETSREYQLKK
jgi:D-proline reductase (dithiol) PrdB